MMETPSFFIWYSQPTASPGSIKTEVLHRAGQENEKEKELLLSYGGIIW